MMDPDLGHESGETRSYHVEWFVMRDARRDVTITIGDDRLLGVESGRTANAIELGNVALIDGLVNTHTHLEFSRLAEPISTTGRFTDWIRQVIQYRRDHPEEVGAAIREGTTESLKSGTTLLGEIATVGWSTADYVDSRFRGVVFQEVLGFSTERVAQQTELAQTFVNDRDAIGFDRGLSPHAPYSTHFSLVRVAVEAAKKSGQSIAMHLAETEAELELLASGKGEFRDFLIGMGIWNGDLFPGRCRPMDYLKLLSEAPRSLIVHGNYLAEDELQFLAARPHMAMVYCPRTHAAFGHTEHPWRRFMDMGGQVVLGTDSRASNPDLSLFAELQFLAARHPDISHLTLLRMGSSDGRRALGVTDSDKANFTLVQLADSSICDLEQDLFGPLNRVSGTMVDGCWGK